MLAISRAVERAHLDNEQNDGVLWVEFGRVDTLEHSALGGCLRLSRRRSDGRRDKRRHGELVGELADGCGRDEQAWGQRETTSAGTGRLGQHTGRAGSSLKRAGSSVSPGLEAGKRAMGASDPTILAQLVGVQRCRVLELWRPLAGGGLHVTDGVVGLVVRLHALGMATSSRRAFHRRGSQPLSMVNGASAAGWLVFVLTGASSKDAPSRHSAQARPAAGPNSPVCASTR